MPAATIPQRSLTASVLQFLENSLSPTIELELSPLDQSFVLEIAGKTHNKVQEVQREEQRILTDRETSDEGKSKKLSELADRSVGSFAFLERIVAQHDEQIRTVEQKLYARLEPPKNEEPMKQLLREWRASELRASMVSENHDAAFLQALDKNDFETVWALTTAPGGSWVSDEVLERGKIEYAKRIDPVALSGKRSLEIVRDRIAGILEFVRSWLLRLGANPATVEKHLSV